MYAVYSAWRKLTSFLALCLLVPGLIFPAGPDRYLPGTSLSPDDPKPSAIEYIHGIGGEIHAVEAQDNLLYMGYGNRLEIYELGHPEGLLPRGRLRLPGLPRDIQLEGGLAYLANGVAGLQIVDIGDPDHPRLLGNYDTPGNASSISVEGNLAYVVDGDVQILDVSQPDQPKLLGSHPTPPGGGIVSIGANDIQVVGNTAYVIYYTTDGQHGATNLTLVDVSDPAHTSVISSIDADLSKQVHVLDGFAYLSPSHFTFSIIDVHEPAHLVKVSMVGCAWGDVYVDGGLAYLSCYDELRIMDVKDPTAPVQIGSLPVVGFNKLAFTKPLLIGLSNLNVDHQPPKNQFHFFDLSNPQKPELVQKHSFTPVSTYLEVQDGPGRMVARWPTYIHDGSGLDIYDISKPANPVIAGSYESLSPITDVKLVGNYAYVGMLYSGLTILDISNPADPQELGTLPIPDGERTLDVWEVEVDGDLALLSGYNHPRMEIVDIRDPRHPVRRGHTGYFGAIRSMKAAGGFAYLTVFDGTQDGLAVFDIKNPDDPRLLKFYPGYLSIAYIDGNLGYGLSAEGLAILDLTHPETPVTVSVYPIPGGADYLSVKDGYAAIIEMETETLLVIDVRDQQHPAVSARYGLPDLRIQAVHWHGPFLYVSTTNGGLQILWFAPPVEALVALDGGQLNSKFDGTAYAFPPAAFSRPVTVTHFPRYPRRNVSGRLGIGHAFEVSGEAVETGESVQPGLPYSLSVHYDSTSLGVDFEKTLAIYAWDGISWVREPTSRVDPVLDLVIAEPDHFGSFAVLGDGQRVFLPAIGKMASPR